jgi:hypothetical protein
MTPTKHTEPGDEQGGIWSPQAERILTKYGLATVLAIAFFYWITSDVSGTVRDIQSRLNDHISETSFYLRQICINTAVDEKGRAACQPPAIR